MKNWPFLLLLLVTFSVRASDNFYTLVERAGFSPMKGAVKEVDLKTIHGKNFSLSTLKGHWVLLNFWATWCGPCRYEMPMVEQLSKKMKGLKVVGVAVDGKDAVAVRKFLNKNQITFTNLLDLGSAAADYQASTVPIAYLVSPDWHVVGMARGAQDWEAIEIQNALKELVKLKKTPEELPKSGGEELEPPKLSFRGIGRSVKKGETFNIEVLVTWNGSPIDYQIRTPELIVPKDVSVGSVSSETSSAADGSALCYIFPITIDKSGKYNLGPVELTYGQKRLKVRGETIEVEVVGQSKLWWLLLLIIPVVGLVVIFYIKKKSPQEVKEVVAGSEKSGFEELLQKKLHMNPVDYQIELLKMVRNLDSEDFDTICKRIDKIRYGGEKMSTEEVSYFEKKLNKHIFMEDE